MEASIAGLLSESENSFIFLSSNVQARVAAINFKINGNEDTVTGYSLRGGQKLKNAVIGLKETLKRGIKKNFQETHYRVLDTRKSGVALDIEVEVMKKAERGIAMVKLYGPYNLKDKKDNVIMVTKYKRSHVKFVKMLAENVIKPLISEFVNEESEDLNESEEEDTKTCHVCEKTFKSPGGLKTHVTKKHKEQTGSILTTEEELLIEKEAFQVVNRLETYKEELDNEKKVTLNETCDIESKDVREFSEVCENCEFEAVADRKYLALQLLCKHKREKHPKICSDCEYKAKNMQELKRHERDNHGRISASTSPPSKKKRNDDGNNDTDSESMDVDENVSNISIQTEEKDPEEMEVDETKILRELSEKMDKKVLEKQARNEEEEKKWAEEKIAKEKNKKDNENQKMENTKKNNRKNKQITKDKRKRSAKKQNNEVKNSFSCIKDVPDNCKTFVNEGDKIFLVPGNGACAPNAAAAHLFQDSNLGPNLRVKMNRFLAEHYEKYENIFPCSEEEPFVRQLKGQEIIFKNPEHLKTFLQNSEIAGYMWSDSEDLKLISDLFQIEIKIISTKGPSDDNPTINRISPDKDMNKFAELQNVEIEEMVLFHERDQHFDLVVSGTGDLARYGNLSDRSSIDVQNGDKVVQENEDLLKEIENLKDKNKMYEKQYLECEKALRKKTEEAERLKSELHDFKLKMSLENELKDDMEEELDTSIDSLDIEFKCNNCDDKFETQEGLRKHLETQHTRNVHQHMYEKDMKTHKRKHSIEEKYKCDDCEYICYKKDELNKHTKTKHISETTKRAHFIVEDEEYNCKDCQYQGDSLYYLQEHIRLTHTLDKYKCKECNYQSTGAKDLYKHSKEIHGMENDNKCTNCEHTCIVTNESGKHVSEKHKENEFIKCKICAKEFNTKSKLMIHRKAEHPNSVASCKNYKEGKCRFEAEFCFWIHREGKEAEIECFFCDKSFNTRDKVMKHRKKEHPKTVKPCQQLKEQKCKFNDEECWFKHGNENENNSNLVFREGKQNLRNT